MIRETGHLPAGNRRVARTQHDPTSIKETTMTETTTPPAALSVGRLARALHEADVATSPGDHPAWDQLTAEAVARFRAMAGLVIERLSGGAGVERAALRDRIANAIARVDSGAWGTETEAMHPYWQKVYRAYADAVLAELPEPADRAAVLREAADFVGNDDDCACGGCDSCVPNKLAAGLRRMADEAQQPAPESAPESAP